MDRLGACIPSGFWTRRFEVNPLSLYEHIMGDSFAQLPAAVQRFHTLSGHHTLEGWVETAAPASSLARLLARCLGTPQRETRGPIRFELNAHSDWESWTRHFPSQTMSSRFRQAGAFVEEHLGASRLRFKLVATGAHLTMALQSMDFLGIPCPRWLLPTIVAEEHGDGEVLHFRVSAALPLIGTVASYRGHLNLGSEVRA